MAGVNSDVTTFGTIRNGRLFLHDRRGFNESLRRFRDGAVVQIEVTKRQAVRSLNQNKYYFGVVLQLLSEHTGYTPDELHDFCKMRFLPKRLAFCDGNGEVKGEYVLGGSTRRLSTIDFGNYMEDIRRWAATDLDVIIPDPNEL